MASLLSCASFRFLGAAVRGSTFASGRRSFLLQPTQLAGHNRWSKIGKSKAIADQKFGKVLSKLLGEVMSAVKDGGPDPSINAALSNVIARAKQNHVSKAQIENSIAKAQSGACSSQMFEMRSSAGYSVMVESISSNASEIRNIMLKACKKHGATLDTGGHAFSKKGLILVEDKSLIDSDLTMVEEVAIEIGCEDFRLVKDENRKVSGVEFITEVDDMHSVARAVREKNIQPKSVQVIYSTNPGSEVSLDEGQMDAAMNFIEYLEELSETVDIYHNIALPAEDMEEPVEG